MYVIFWPLLLVALLINYDDDNCSASANRLVPINSLFPDSVSRPRVSQVEVTYSDSCLRH